MQLEHETGHAATERQMLLRKEVFMEAATWGQEVLNARL